MTSWKDRLMGKGEAKAPAKQPAKAAPKSTRPKRRSVRTIKGDLEGSLADLIALARSDPYLTDATAMLTQAVVFLEKQLITEGIDQPTKPEPEG